MNNLTLLTNKVLDNLGSVSYAVKEVINKTFFQAKVGYFYLALFFLLSLTEHFSYEETASESLQSAQKIRYSITSYIKKKNISKNQKETRELTNQVIKLSKKITFYPQTTIGGDSVNRIAFLLAVIETESQFTRNAVSRVGALGYMQLMPNTAKFIARNQKLSKREIIDTKTNLNFGVTYINDMLKQMGNLKKAMLAYNAGPGAVLRWGGVKAYWNKIILHYIEIKDHFFKAKQLLFTKAIVAN